MKKRKFSLILNIASICLAICATAFGIYALKTASLNLNGTVGFKAHNCDVNVYCTLSGAADEEGNEITVSAFGSPTQYVNLQDSATWDIGTIYFNDMSDKIDGDIAKNIQITINMYNTSGYAVYGTFNPAVVNDSKIEVSVSEPVVVMPANQSRDNAITITVTLKLLDNTFKSVTLSNTQALFNFDKEVVTKTTLPVLKTAPISTDIDNEFVTMFPYYVSFGEDSGKPIAWHIIGVINTDNSVTTFNESTHLTSDKKLKEEYNYCFLSRYLLSSSTSTGNKGLAYQNSAYVVDYTQTGGPMNGYTDSTKSISATDYYSSTMRKFLNNEQVYGTKLGTSTTSGSATNKTYVADNSIVATLFQTNYKLSNTYSVINSLINKRSLEDLYKASTKPTYIESSVWTVKSEKFWILSSNEATTMLNCNTSAAVSKCFGRYQTVNKFAKWVTRTESSANGSTGVCLASSGTYMFGGSYGYTNIFTEDCGVRPAFCL